MLFWLGSLGGYLHLFEPHSLRRMEAELPPSPIRWDGVAAGRVSFYKRYPPPPIFIQSDLVGFARI